MARATLSLHLLIDHISMLSYLVDINLELTIQVLLVSLSKAQAVKDFGNQRFRD